MRGQVKKRSKAKKQKQTNPQTNLRFSQDGRWILEALTTHYVNSVMGGRVDWTMVSVVEKLVRDEALREGVPTVKHRM